MIHAHDSAPTPTGVVPRWFARVLIVVLAAVTGVGVTVLLLAMLGWASTPALILGGIPSSVLLAALGLRALAASGASDITASDHRWAVAVMVLVLASALGNAVYSGDHVMVDRDPGIYTTTGRWIAKTGSLDIHAAVGPFAAREELTYQSDGFARDDDGRLEVQGAHLLPALLAVADEVGGSRLMFGVPAVLSAAALLAVYGVANRLARRPSLAFAATTALAVSLPYLHVARDAYTEGLTLLLVWGAGWAWMQLVGRDGVAPTVPGAAFCGAVLGAGVATRVDGALYLVAIPLAVAWLYRATRSWRVPLAFVGCVSATSAIGAYDLLVWSTVYVRALRDETVAMVIAVGVAWLVIVAVLLLARGPAWSSRGRSLVSRTAPVAGAALAVFLAAMWLLRPVLQTDRAADANGFIAVIQASEGLAVDPTRRYGELAFRWMSWYVGPVTAVLAIAAAAIMVVRLLRRSDPALGFPLISIGAAALAYLLRPSIVPDQLWATRRFLPNGLPLMVTLGAVALAMILRAERVQHVLGRAGRFGPPAAVAGAFAILVAPPVVATAPIAEFSHQKGYLEPVQAACEHMGSDAVVLTLEGHESNRVLTQPIRAWCDVPVAGIPPGPADRQVELVRDLQHAWGALGRSVWLITDNRELLSQVDPAAEFDAIWLQATTAKQPVRTLDRRPDAYEVAGYGFVLGEIPPPE